jgi:hypothetical protein
MLVAAMMVMTTVVMMAPMPSTVTNLLDRIYSFCRRLDHGAVDHAGS